MTRMTHEADRRRKRQITAERRRLNRCTQCGTSRPRKGRDTCNVCAERNRHRDGGETQPGSWGDTQTLDLEIAVREASCFRAPREALAL